MDPFTPLGDDQALEQYLSECNRCRISKALRESVRLAKTGQQEIVQMSRLSLAF